LIFSNILCDSATTTREVPKPQTNDPSSMLSIRSHLLRTLRLDYSEETGHTTIPASQLVLATQTFFFSAGPSFAGNLGSRSKTQRQVETNSRRKTVFGRVKICFGRSRNRKIQKSLCTKSKTQQTNKKIDSGAIFLQPVGASKQRARSNVEQKSKTEVPPFKPSV
jgi:hypothetical protein